MKYFTRRKKAFGYAIKGLRHFFLTEDHPKIHALAAVIAVCLAFFLDVNFVEWLGIIFSIAIVLSAEAINSALENLTDIASPRIFGESWLG